jgi:hypothetical protein
MRALSAPRSIRTVAWLWLVAVVLSLYGAEDVRIWVRTSAVGVDHPWLARSSDRLVAAARSAGLIALRRTLDAATSHRPIAAVSAGPPAAALVADPPSPAKPGGDRPVARVLIVGASTIQFHLGVELERALRARHPALEIERLGKLSTGLTRPDVFDWPARLRELSGRFSPDLVVANFGGNDGQSMELEGRRLARFGTPDWDRAYRARVAEVVKIARDTGARILMLGMPTTRDDVLTRRMARINGLTEEATRAAGGDFLSTWDIGASGGRFQDVIVVDGVALHSRLADGKHFSRSGAQYAANVICQRLEQRYSFVSEDATPNAVGSAPRH